MREERPTKSRASQSGSVKAVAVEETVPLLNSLYEIEVASGGSGTVNDPSGRDTRPPVTSDFDPLLQLA